VVTVIEVEAVTPLPLALMVYVPTTIGEAGT
jgi:hypothetical protein